MRLTRAKCQRLLAHSLNKTIRVLLFAVLLLPFSAPAFAQTYYAALPNAQIQFFDDSGIPLAGGLLYTYQAGTVTPQATYTDSTGNTQNANPVVLDASGRASVWLSSVGPYKLVLQTSVGGAVWTKDNVSDFGAVLKRDLATSFTTKSMDNVRLCDQYSGATADAQISNCITDLPSSGGTADARGLQGAQTWSGCPFTGVTKPVRAWIGLSTQTIPADCFATTVQVIDFSKTQAVIGNAGGYTANALFDSSNGAGTTNRVFGLASQIHANAGGDGVASHGEAVGLFAGAERTGGSTRPIWAWNSVTSVPSGQRLNQSIGGEIDFNNNASDVALTNAAVDQQIALAIVSGGSFKPLSAITVTSSSAAGRFQKGASFNNWQTHGVEILQDSASPAVTGPALWMAPSSDSGNLIMEIVNAAQTGDVFRILQTGAVQFANNTGIYWADTGGTYRLGIYDGGDDTKHVLVGNSGNGQLELQDGTSELQWNSAGITTGTKLTINTSLDPNGTGLKHARSSSCTTAASAGATCDTTVTWGGSAFANVSYSVNCTMSAASNNPIVVQTKTKNTTSAVVTIGALTAAAASGTLDCVAFHD